MAQSLDNQVASDDTKISKARGFHNGSDDDDFDNSSGVRIFGICKVGHGHGTTCGIYYMPGTVWAQPNKEQFQVLLTQPEADRDGRAQAHREHKCGRKSKSR